MLCPLPRSLPPLPPPSPSTPPAHQPLAQAVELVERVQQHAGAADGEEAVAARPQAQLGGHVHVAVPRALLTGRAAAAAGAGASASVWLGGGQADKRRAPARHQARAAQAPHLRHHRLKQLGSLPEGHQVRRVRQQAPRPPRAALLAQHPPRRGARLRWRRRAAQRVCWARGGAQQAEIGTRRGLRLAHACRHILYAEARRRRRQHPRSGARSPASPLGSARRAAGWPGRPQAAQTRGGSCGRAAGP